MKILLIRPPAKYFKGASPPAIDLPLGIMYIGSVLRNSGYVVQIYDALVKVNASSRNTMLTNGHFGASWKEIEDVVKNEKPDIVGIANQFTSQLENAIQTAEIIKKIDKKIVTIIGGNHSTVSPITFFTMTNCIDIVCIGEGEDVVPDIVKYYNNEVLLEDIEGIAYKKNGNIQVNKKRSFISDLDELPFPAYDMVDLEEYFNAIRNGFFSREMHTYTGSERAISMITSRGCPFDCVFCSIHLHMGKKWRKHSSEYVLRHLQFVTKEYGIRHIHFEDDNLTMDLNRFDNIINGIMHNNLNITWDTPNGVRADFLDKNILLKSKRSGCTYLYIGVESGSEEIQKNVVRKKLDLSKVIQVSKWCEEIGLDLGAFFVIGFPGETISDMEKTIDFALSLRRKYRVNSNLYIANPLIGTELYKTCSDNGYFVEEVTPDTLAKGIDTRSLIKTDDFTPDDITVLRKGYFEKCKRIMVYNFLLFLMKNPNALYRFIAILLTTKPAQIKNTIVRYMFLSNCLMG